MHSFAVSSLGVPPKFSVGALVVAIVGAVKSGEPSQG